MNTEQLRRLNVLQKKNKQTKTPNKIPTFIQSWVTASSTSVKSGTGSFVWTASEVEPLLRATLWSYICRICCVHAWCAYYSRVFEMQIWSILEMPLALVYFETLLAWVARNVEFWKNWRRHSRLLPDQSRRILLRFVTLLSRGRKRPRLYHQLVNAAWIMN